MLFRTSFFSININRPKKIEREREKKKILAQQQERIESAVKQCALDDFVVFIRFEISQKEKKNTHQRVYIPIRAKKSTKTKKKEY